MTVCAACHLEAERTITAYWNNDKLCPTCCEKVAAVLDEHDAWPPTDHDLNAELDRLCLLLNLPDGPDRPSDLGTSIAQIRAEIVHRRRTHLTPRQWDVEAEVEA